MGESSSKEQSHVAGSPISLRRTRQAVAKENSPSATPEKREKMKKKNQGSHRKGNIR